MSSDQLNRKCPYGVSVTEIVVQSTSMILMYNILFEFILKNCLYYYPLYNKNLKLSHFCIFSKRVQYVDIQYPLHFNKRTIVKNFLKPFQWKLKFEKWVLLIEIDKRFNYFSFIRQWCLEIQNWWNCLALYPFKRLFT